MTVEQPGRRMPAPGPGPRLALGGVRENLRRYDPLPAEGPARAAALRQLKAVITADVVRTLNSAVMAGWHPLDHEEIVEGYLEWARRFIAEAIFAGVVTWRDSADVSADISQSQARCPICGAQISDGRCWGCGAL